MSTMQVEIVSAEGHIYSGMAEMLVAPAKMGDVGITPRHAPLLTNLRPGEIRVQTPEADDELFFYVTGGVLEVQPHAELTAPLLQQQQQLLTRQAAESVARARHLPAAVERVDVGPVGEVVPNARVALGIRDLEVAERLV